MTAPRTIPSNVSGLSYAEELSIGVLPVTPIWKPFEPNSYKDFGGEIKVVARQPINASRQRKKGVVVDLDASGGFVTDLTQSNLQDVLQGFLFASFRTKNQLTTTAVDGTTNAYTVASGGTAYRVNDLIFAKNHALSVNNGLKVVQATVTGTSIPVTDAGLLTDTGGIITRVGFQFASGDATISNPGGAFPTFGATAKDLTQLGLIPGEWVFIGGDLTAEKFATAANTCLARVRSVTAALITFDKTENTLVTDAGAAKTIRLFFAPRIAKNEALRADQFRRTYQLERTLGKADSADAFDQVEYLIGSVPSKFTLTFKSNEILTAELEFMSTDHQTFDGATGPKSGTRETLVEADAFNSTGDVVRLALSPVSTTDANPLPYFAFITDLEVSIDNNLSQNKAVSALGSIEQTEGLFAVDANATAYFVKIASIVAVRANSDASLDFTLAKANAGITVDMPLLAIGDARAEVKLDEPIMLPIKNPAATGSKITTTLDHTIMFCFWDYLPTSAMPSA